MRSKLYMLACLGAGLSLASCVKLGGAAPPESLFTLTAARADTSAEGGAAKPRGRNSAIIVIAEPSVPQMLNVTRIPVQVDDTSVAYLKDAVWIEPPARLFQRVVKEVVAQKSGAIVVTQAEAKLGRSIRLSGELQQFTYDARTSSVIVRFDARKDILGADGAIMTSEMRRFEVVEPGVTPQGRAVSRALNAATNNAALEIADWLN